MNSLEPSRTARLNIPNVYTRNIPFKILLAGVNSRKAHIWKTFSERASSCLIATNTDNAIEILSNQTDISLVAVDMPHSPNRCVLCLFMRTYFPAIPFLLISEDNTLDHMACIHCSKNCSATLVNRTLGLNVQKRCLTCRAAPEDSLKANRYVADGDS